MECSDRRSGNIINRQGRNIKKKDSKRNIVS